MLAAIEHHLEPLRAEPDHEILTVSDDRYADAAGQRSPFPQLEDVLGDVRFFELAAVFPQPILDEVAVGSSRRTVNLDVSHRRILPGPVSALYSMLILR
jgi:hypothetical protein